VEEGYVRVEDMVGRQPWLDESFEFPVEVMGGPGAKGDGATVPAAAALPAP
jgi:hypothetical protein